ncbi:Gfo/Idh/MocA family oxidoreductase [Gammaproteobacteria bacterium]|nr:Gfo/Idh/MocA family oxidoreductase [Gammaproteobacteria bacterium]
MQKINVAIAGYGKMGKIRENSFLQFPEINLVSIFDSNKKDIQTSSEVCNSYEELLDSGVDAVFVSTYVNVSAEYVLRALKKGKHVFCEKPPSTSLDELEEIKEFQQNSNLVLKYGFNHRFHYSVMEAKKLIEKGEMGKLLWMRGVYGKAGSLDFKKNWRSYKEYAGGGILMDQGIHMLDLFRYFSGEEFYCLASYLDSIFWDVESEDNAFVMLKSNSGKIATLHSTANQWRHKFLLELTFEKGYINLDGILSSTGSYAPEKLIHSYRSEEDVEKGMGRPLESTSTYEVDNSWKYEIEEFLTSVKGISPLRNGTLEDASFIMKLVEDIYNSNK